MPDLASQLRGLIDTEAPPLSVDEVRRQAVQRRHPPRWNRLTMITLGVAAALVVGVLLVLTQRHPSPHPPRTTVLQSLPAGLLSCLANPPAQDGCHVSVPVAEQMLGISIPQPVTVPPGWVVIMQDVRQWPSNYADIKGVIPADFNQVWAPPGTDLGSTTTPPTFVQYNVQSAANYTPQGLQSFLVIGPSLTLPDGMAVHGTLTDTAIALDWITGGNVYRLRTGAPMPVQIVDQFVDSLR